ncbi:hypothetical protein E4U09_000568 [Claviceps aff. purpurea]|uniref:Uncharacterized protein n=1 Tax=Claviceps aff. purpurea TaxID=1967640 RepID=A0A9P7Q9F2_9HYPO|nr:hypothetical protein E4U09_000568 [Claviceps aff. purpurea]
MKGKWKEWCRHLGRVSGWGRDPNGVPFNEKEIEDAYFTQHADSKIFRRKAPACRDQMETLLGATQATGQHAPSLDQTLMGGEGGDDDDEGWEDLLGEMMSGANGLGPQADGGAAAAGGEGGGDGDDGLDDAGGDTTSIETIGDNDTPPNPAHRGNTSARGNATNIPGRLTRVTTPRPSTTRSHRKEDAAASSFERTVNRSTAVLADIARAQERNALTRATARISALEFVVGLDVRRRMSVIRAMAKDGNEHIVLGLRDEDMQPYVEMLLEDMAGPPPAPPQQQQQQYGQYGQRMGGLTDGWSD